MLSINIKLINKNLNIFKKNIKILKYLFYFEKRWRDDITLKIFVISCEENQLMSFLILELLGFILNSG